MTNLDIQSAYLGLDPVDRVYLGTDVVYEASGEPAPIEFNEWYGQGSDSRTLGHVLLIKQGSTIWTTPGGLGYLADSDTTDTGSSHYVIEIQRGAPTQMPLRYHNTGTTTWSFLMPNSTETIDGVTYDRYDLPTNVYLGLNKSFFASSVPQDNLYILPQ